MVNDRRVTGETETSLSMESYKEMEYRLSCLRSLVCDLLKANQDLRDALLGAGIAPRDDKDRNHVESGSIPKVSCPRSDLR